MHVSRQREPRTKTDRRPRNPFAQFPLINTPVQLIVRLFLFPDRPRRPLDKKVQPKAMSGSMAHIKSSRQPPRTTLLGLLARLTLGDRASGTNTLIDEDPRLPCCTCEDHRLHWSVACWGPRHVSRLSPAN
ncbi:hypothetical protein CRV24_004906 [Beauveria bassiana]|nr:hypothetical protein CRV24_004906 [Beauveria bassiana]